jgi:hypothetical protein
MHLFAHCIDGSYLFDSSLFQTVKWMEISKFEETKKTLE